MNITVKIEAPELAKAIESLAAALAGNQVAPKNVLQKAMEKEANKTTDTSNKKEEKKEVAPDPQPEVEDKKEEPAVSLEAVRSKLAALSQSGKQAQVKELISQFGAKKLTEVPAEKYTDLLAAAEEIA